MDAADSRSSEGPETNSRCLYISMHYGFHFDPNKMDEEECRSIISGLIYPKLTREWNHNLNTTFHGCPCLNKPFRSRCFPMCEDYYIIQSLCGSHKSILLWSLEFSRNRLGSEDDCNQAMNLLCLLLAVARERQQWDTINNWMAELLNHNRSDIRAYANRIFLHMVRPDAQNLERLTEHFETMIKMFNDPSKKVREENRCVWKIMSQSRRLGPQGHKLMRTITDLWRFELNSMVDMPVPDCPFLREFNQPEPILEALSNYAWLIMPRLEVNNNHIDFQAASYQLFKDITQLNRVDSLLKKFFEIFRCVIYKYGRHDDLDIRLCLILNRFYWLSLRDRFNVMLQPQISFTSREVKLSRVDYQDYFKFMMEMYEDKLTYTDSRIATLLFDISSAIQMPDISRSVDIKKYSNGHKILNAMIEQNSQLLNRNVYISAENLYNQAPVLADRMRHFLRGIQTRRLVVILLCRELIHFDSYPQVAFRIVPFIMYLLGQLRAAYKARIAQTSTEDDRENSLLPTCLELALQTPFDDPESKIYVCEFAYFRDIFDYLQRKRLNLYKPICDALSDEYKRQLHHYRYEYNDFHTCCSATSSEGEQFQCIDHECLESDSIQGICPILDRKPI